MPQIFRILLPVTDIQQAKSFYTKVLGVEGFPVSPGRHYFDCEGIILACFDPQSDGDGYTAQPNPEDLYIAVDNIEETYTHCNEAGATFSDFEDPDVGKMGVIEKRPWGEVSFYIKDPFGNGICFVDRKTVFTG